MGSRRAADGNEGDMAADVSRPFACSSVYHPVARQQIAVGKSPISSSLAVFSFGGGLFDDLPPECTHGCGPGEVVRRGLVRSVSFRGDICFNMEKGRSGHGAGTVFACQREDGFASVAGLYAPVGLVDGAEDCTGTSHNGLDSNNRFLHCFYGPLDFDQ